MSLVQLLGMIGALAMPIWNVPLIVRIIRRGSSKDMSLYWATGVWICVLLMLPSSLVSEDLVLKMFGVVNAIAFTIVFGVILKYRK